MLGFVCIKYKVLYLVDNTNFLPNPDCCMKKKETHSTFYEYASLKELGDKQQELIQKAVEAASSAYAPYSQFYVGAAVVLENGTIIQGSNQENSAFPSGLCAERTAVFYANSQYPDTPIVALAVVAKKDGKIVEKPVPPCGSCLQVLLESEKRHQTNIEVILYGSSVIHRAANIEQFLPFGFTSLDLGGS
jgi:cytidine deaminase